MVVPGADAAKAQVDRLKALGYAVIDVVSTAQPPPLATAIVRTDPLARM
jgi:hypothetical protein